MPIPWGLIATTGLSSGIAVVVAEFAIGQYRDAKERKRHAGFLALEVCFSLERYAIEVADKIADEEEVEVHPGEYLQHVISHVPKFPSLPESDHYDQFKLDILDKIYEFPDRISLTNGFVNYIAANSDEKDAYNYATKHAGIIATDAMDLAAKIRALYKLPARALKHGEYDVRKQLANT